MAKKKKIEETDMERVELEEDIEEDTGKKAAKKDVEESGTEEKSRREKIIVTATLARERVITESTDAAREFYDQSRYGQIIEDGKVQLSLLEALYLMEKKRLVVTDGKGKAIEFDPYLKKASKVEPNFWIRYCVFKDLRNRGYIVKTALKFGADFRVYDRGVKPGEDHAKWIVYPVHEGEQNTWYEFSAKNRVAHSTRKRLLIGVVDDEGDVTYYEIRWVRP
ncbi:TPA: tRNA-intron lyase [Candidatus Woesearchaeota archaeon]|nr:tRNA-intron lyase [Candidatus Woesearchaeota archaeon]